MICVINSTQTLNLTNDVKLPIKTLVTYVRCYNAIHFCGYVPQSGSLYLIGMLNKRMNEGVSQMSVNLLDKRGMLGYQLFSCSKCQMSSEVTPMFSCW